MPLLHLAGCEVSVPVKQKTNIFCECKIEFCIKYSRIKIKIEEKFQQINAKADLQKTGWGG